MQLAQNSHLQIPNQVRTNETIIEALKFITDGVVAGLADDIFQTRHHVIYKALMNSLIHRGLSLFSALDIENAHEGLYCDALKEHGEVNHAYCRRNEERGQGHVMWVNEEHQCECNRPSQAAI